jgi:hypothetical protein
MDSLYYSNKGKMIISGALGKADVLADRICTKAWDILPPVGENAAIEALRVLTWVLRLVRSFSMVVKSRFVRMIEFGIGAAKVRVKMARVVVMGNREVRWTIVDSWDSWDA